MVEPNAAVLSAAGIDVVEVKSKWHGGTDFDRVQAELDRLGLQGWQLVTWLNAGERTSSSIWSAWRDPATQRPSTDAA